jgi:hypothetical protein
MTTTEVDLVVAAAGLLGSIGVSAFVSGMRWGAVDERIRTIEHNLAEIKGMFTLTLKDK